MSKCEVEALEKEIERKDDEIRQKDMRIDYLLERLNDIYEEAMIYDSLKKIRDTASESRFKYTEVGEDQWPMS